MKKILIAYFSATGTTARVAHELAKAAGGELFAIVPHDPYTIEDLDWHNSQSRSSLEMADENCQPQVSSKVANMNDYDLIFLGFPIWWHRAPRIIDTFLKQYDFSGKAIAPFATSGGSPMGNTEALLEKVCPQAHWLPGRKLSAMASAADLRDWVNTLEKFGKEG